MVLWRTTIVRQAKGEVPDTTYDPISAKLEAVVGL
jgi:hypothetical protein